MGRDAEAGRNLFLALAFVGQLSEGLELVGVMPAGAFCRVVRIESRTVRTHLTKRGGTEWPAGIPPRKDAFIICCAKCCAWSAECSSAW